MGLEFFKQYGGQRTRQTSRRSVFAEINTNQLTEMLSAYEEMAETKKRPDGSDLSETTLKTIAKQIGLMKAELSGRN